MFIHELDEEYIKQFSKAKTLFFKTKRLFYLLRVGWTKSHYIYIQQNIDHCFNLHTHCCDTKEIVQYAQKPDVKY